MSSSFLDKNATDEETQDTSPTQVEAVKVSDASTQRHQDDVTFGAAASPSDRPQPPAEPLVLQLTLPLCCLTHLLLVLKSNCCSTKHFGPFVKFRPSD